jgi:hypothetical protein
MTGFAVRLLTAAALAVSAYVHVDLSSSPYYAGGQLALGALFLGQAVVAGLVALWVLGRPSRVAYTVAAAVAAASFSALVLSTYVRLPSVGPFPVLYEPVWYADKVVAAGSAGVALLAAAAGLAVAARRVR